MAPTFDIPERKTQLSRYFFKRSAETVARELLGRVFVVSRARGHPFYARLHEIAAYEGEAETAAKSIKYAPGIMGISTKYGKNLIDIATGKEGKSSCVTLIAAEIRDGAGLREFAQGAGNLAKALEIDRSYDGLPLNETHKTPLWIGGEPIDQILICSRDRSNMPENWKGTFYFRSEPAQEPSLASACS